MADVKFEVATFEWDTTSVTPFNVTIPGFGTPVACIIEMNLQTAATPQSGNESSFGFYDGTNQHSLGQRALTGATSQTAQSLTSGVIAVQTSISTGAPYVALQATALINDGVTLQTSTTGTATSNKCIITLIGGTDAANAYAGIFTLNAGANAITAPGFQPNLIYFNGHNRPNAAQESGLWASVGIAVDDGALSQRSIMWTQDDGIATTTHEAYISNVYCIGSYDASVWTRGNVTSYDALGFTINGAGTVGRLHGYLAIELTGSPDIAIYDTTVPDVGNVSVTGLGFQPAYSRLYTHQGLTAYETGINSGSLLGSGVTSFDATTMATMSWSSEDASGGLGEDPYTYRSTDFTLLNYQNGSTAAQSSGYTLDSDGFTITLTTNPGAAIMGFGLAIGPGTTPLTFSLSPLSSPLPAGLSVNATTGNIEGTPTETGTFPNIIIRGSE